MVCSFPLRDPFMIFEVALRLVDATERECLAARGLLTSRGIVERMLQMVAKERLIRGHFNATDTITQIKHHPQSGLLYLKFQFFLPLCSRPF